MSIIQKIRDNSWIMLVMITLAIIAFIFMGAESTLFGGGDNPTIGTINGKKIKRNSFTERLAALRAAYKGNPQATEVALNNAVWQTMTDEITMSGEYDPLLENMSDKQLSDYAIGKTGVPSQYMTQLFKTYFGNECLDPQTQALSPQYAEMVLNQNNPRPEIREVQMYFKSMLPMVRNEIVTGRFSGIMENTVIIPDWVVDKTIADSKAMTSVSFVEVPYSDVNDSTVTEVKATDADIKAYIAKNPNKFKVEEQRDIDYVSFDYNATSEDSAIIKNKIVADLDKLNKASDDNIATVIAASGSMVEYQKYYARKSTLILDSTKAYIAKQIIEPFVKQGAYIAAKVIDVKMYADSASARHILVKIDQNRDETAAKKLMDSIVAQYKAGAAFDSLAKKYSEDPGSKDSGGLYKNFPFNQMVPEFNNFAFGAIVGDTTVVKTNFGLHFIKAEGTKGTPKPAYNVAYIAKAIAPSTATKENANRKATEFSSNNRSAKAFDDYLVKNPTILKRNGYGIGRTNQAVQGLNGDVSDVVRWAFNNKTKVNDVSDVFNVKDQNLYVVAKLVKQQSEGTMSIDEVKKNPMLTSIITLNKKYEYLSKKYKMPGSIEEAATLTGKTVMTKDSIAFNGVIPGLNEPKVVGYAFNKDAASKVSGPIKGESGLYYVKANGAVFQNADKMVNATMVKKQELQKLQEEFRILYEAYRKSATIKDKRLENQM